MQRLSKNALVSPKLGFVTTSLKTLCRAAEESFCTSSLSLCFSTLKLVRNAEKALAKTLILSLAPKCECILRSIFKNQESKYAVISRALTLIPYII